MKGWILGDHLSCDARAALIGGRGEGTEKGWVVIGGGAENLPRSVETQTPGVVVELMEELHLTPIGAHVEHPIAKANVLIALPAAVARVTHRAPDMVVQAVTQVGRPGMGVGDSPTRVEHFPDISHVVSIGILEKKKIRGMRHDDPAVSKDHGGGHVEAFGKDLDRVTAAIAIGILKDLDAVPTLAIGGQFIGVVHRFSHPEAPAVIPSHADGVDDVWFTGKKLQSESYRHARVLHALLRRKWKLVGKRLRAALIVGNMIALLIGQRGAVLEEVLVTAQT